MIESALWVLWWHGQVQKPPVHPLRIEKRARDPNNPLIIQPKREQDARASFKFNREALRSRRPGQLHTTDGGLAQLNHEAGLRGSIW